MRPLLITLISFLMLAGCEQFDAASDDDIPRLTAIDKRLVGGDYEYAVGAAREYVEEFPESYRGWGILGWAYLKTDQLEPAEECFEKSLAINPKWDNAYVGKGVMYRKMGQNDEARAAYLKAISIVPDNAEAYSSLLVIELLEGNDDKAIEYGEKAWGLRKNLASIPANLAIAYHYAGNTAQRDRYYEHSKKLNYHALDQLQKIFDGEVSLR